MADCSDRRSSLPLGGTSQAERGSPALLDPAYVAISGEGYADWIVFAAKFSKHLKFFDSATGTITGDWHTFFTRDVSAVLAGVAVADVDGYRGEVKQRMDLLRSNTPVPTEDRTTALTELIAAILALSLALDERLGQLGAAPDLARLIE